MCSSDLVSDLVFGVLSVSYLVFGVQSVSDLVFGLAKSFLQFFGFILFFIFYLFFYCVGSSLLHAGFSLVAASRGYSPLRCAGFSLWWFLLLQSTGSMQAGFSSCGTWVQ